MPAHLSRRRFLQGCAAGLLTAAQGTRLGNLVCAAEPVGADQDIIINIFLRGGMDALSYLVPHGEDNYHIARARLGMSTAQVLDFNGLLGLHPAAARLYELSQAGHAAFICACGSPHPTRSHFDAQDYMDRGILDQGHLNEGGWLGRHLKRYPSSAVFQAISRGSSLPLSLAGAPNAIAMESAEDYTINGQWDEEDDMRRALRAIYGADAGLGPTALNTLQAADLIEYADPDNYTPANGATYPNNGLGDALSSLAQLIRLDLGLMAATVDFGGWDTHESQADGGNASTGYYANQVQQLSEAIYAMWTDLAEYHGRLTILVMSEFGRRLKENNNRGTDHGHGGQMTVVSGNLVRGGLFGKWPGLGTDELFEDVDLQVTTDYRNVLCETLIARTKTRDVGNIFPGFNFNNPPGIFGIKNAIEPTAGRAWLELAG